MTFREINYDHYVDVIIGEGIKVVETAGNNPGRIISRLKAAGIKVIHKCTTVRHAKKAEELGCDVASIDGYECAGHPGEDDVGGLVLIPAAASTLKIPIIASGGIGDGRGWWLPWPSERKALIEEMRPILSGTRGESMIQDGVVDEGIMSVGQCIGLINDIPTVKEVIDRIIKEATQIVNGRLSRLVKV